MQPIRIALVQLAWTGSRDSMTAQLQDLIAHAAGGGARLVCLPEFSLLPYFPSSLDASGFAWAESLPDGASAQFFSQMARQYQVALVGSLFERTPDGQHFDTATLHAPDGRLIGFTRKVHIPSGIGYHETHFFSGSDQYPVFQIGGLKLATPACYDQWFPELARIYALNGAELIFYPTAIGSEPTDPTLDSQPQWELVMRGHAIANGVFIAAANRVGIENGVTFYGSSFVCDPMGNLLAKAGRDTTDVIFADLDPAVMARWRGLFPLLHQRKPAAYGRLLEGYEGEKPSWLDDATMR